ncbi:MAG: hypothetical protein J2P46_12320 [Zavarzinella sp.]|nr:hypothetical protein [Zavarzinella sp.]
MKTITTTAVIGPDRVLTVHLPPDVSPGPHEIVVVLNGAAVSPVPLLSPPYQLAERDSSVTFSREDIYGDDGR